MTFLDLLIFLPKRNQNKIMEPSFNALWFFAYTIMILFCIVSVISPVDASTLQIYPVLDGTISRAPTGAGYNMTYPNASMKQGTTTALTGATGIIGAYTGTATTTNNFSQVIRAYFTFDLLPISPDVTITGAYLRIVPSAKTVTLGTPALVVIPFTPNNKLSYVSDDYNKTSLVPLSSYLENTNINTGYENLIPLNSAGVSLIQSSITSRYVSLGLGTNWDINQTDIPINLLWGVSRSAIYTIYLSEQTDTINDAYLLLVYSSPSAQNIVNTNLTSNNTIVINIQNINNLTANITTNAPNQEAFFSFINQYILILLVLLVLVVAMFTEPFIAFIGFIIAFIGLTTTINFSFEFGTIFVILMCASFFIGVKGED